MRWKLGNSISFKSYAALDNLDDSRKINRALQNVRRNIKISPKEKGQYEWKLHEPRFGEECSKFVYQKKQAKLQWLQNPRQINADNMNN
jgi:hypothetical protein